MTSCLIKENWKVDLEIDWAQLVGSVNALDKMNWYMNWANYWIRCLEWAWIQMRYDSNWI